jgi:chemotaxis protein CheC
LTERDNQVLTESQLHVFGQLLHHGAAEASTALERWIGKHTSIAMDAVEQLPICEATSVLGVGDEPIGFCVAEIGGRLTGELILAFDDASGLALADLLLGQPGGTAKGWGEMETSAALETTNIVGSTYLNVLARNLPEGTGTSELILSPPRFSHDFAESLLEFALMGQIVASDKVLLARAQFRIDGDPVQWTMLLLPDAQSMSSLCGLIKK